MNDWRTDEEIAVFNEGYRAYQDGFSDDVNPYQFGTALHNSWEYGWDAAFELGYRGFVKDQQDKLLDDPRR